MRTIFQFLILLKLNLNLRFRHLATSVAKNASSEMMIELRQLLVSISVSFVYLK